MPHPVRLLAGTRKGLFILDGNDGDWTISGPFCEAWPINHAICDPASGAIHAAGGNEWFGPAVWTSRDGGETWSHSSAGLAHPEGEEPVKSAWSLAAGDGVLYAGVQPAGLFRSTDGGESWTPLDALRTHPSRERWMPGGAGLILHHILVDPSDARRLWVGISAAGVFASEDGGESWEPRNRGTRSDFMPEDQRYPEVGQCVHSLVMAAGGNGRLYQQNHCGMYRSDDRGRSWDSIEKGLPSTFGFPAAAHPRCADTLYLFPLNGDSAGRFAPEGRVAVWRTRDAGASWTDLRDGLPQKDAFLTVLRQGMAADTHDPAGIYFGTTSGEIYASRDEGDSWQRIAEHLPLISSLEVARAGAA